MTGRTRARQQGRASRILSARWLSADAEDSFLKLRFQETLDDEICTNHPICEPGPPWQHWISANRNTIIKGQLERQIASLKYQSPRLHEDNDAREQYGRRNNMRMSGLAKPKQEHCQAENIIGIVVDLAKEILKLDPSLWTTDTEVSHCLKQPKPSKKESQVQLLFGTDRNRNELGTNLDCNNLK